MSKVGIAVRSVINVVAILFTLILIMATIDSVRQEHEYSTIDFIRMDVNYGHYAGAYYDYSLLNRDKLSDEREVAKYDEFMRFYDDYIWYVESQDEKALAEMKEIIANTIYPDNVPHYEFLIAQFDK